MDVPYTLKNFAINMLNGRSIKLDSSNDSRLLWKGLPQGSVLSPLLYNIYTYDLEQVLTDSVNILQYADDIVIYCKDKSIINATNHITSSLANLKVWFDKHGFKLSTAKSVSVLYSRFRNPPNINIKYDNQLIIQKTEATFLGFVLDAKLSGIPHCDYIVSKCERRLNMLRCLAGVWWGAHPFSLKLVYSALIRSVLDYGSFLLEPCRVTVSKRFDAIQSKALRIISGAMKSSPLNALQVECVEPPLNIRRQYLSDRFLFRTVQFINHPLILKLYTLLNLMSSSTYWQFKTTPCLINSIQKCKAFSAPTYSTKNLPLFCNNYEALIFSPTIHLNLGIAKGDINANTEFNVIVDEKWKGWHHLYCDASKHGVNGKVGIGVYHREFGIVQKIKLPPESSTFTGESLGILKALDYILLARLGKSIIVSDSMSALQALNKFPITCKPQVSAIIIAIREKLYRCLCRRYSVEFVWIPSHSGIKGNDKADSLANDAVLSGDVCPYINYCQDLINLSKLYLQKSWSEVWKKSSLFKGRYYYSIQPKINLKPWFSKTDIGKMATSTLIRLRLGHVCSPAHLARFNIISSPKCECGHEVCDVNHMLLACPLYDHSSFYQTLESMNLQFPLNIRCLLATNNLSIYKTISEFLLLNSIKL